MGVKGFLYRKIFPRNINMRMLSFLRGYRRILFLIVMTGIGAALLEGFGIALVFPILQGASDLGGTNTPFPLGYLSSIFLHISLKDRLQIIALLLFTSVAVKNLLLFISMMLGSRLQLNVIKDFRVRCLYGLTRVGMNFFNKQRIADLHTIITDYIESGAGAIAKLVGSALVQAVTTIILLMFLFLISWRLTLFSLLFVFFTSIILGGIMRRISLQGSRLIEARRQLSSTFFDILRGMKLVRLFNREDSKIDEARITIEKFNKVRYKADMWSGMIGPVFETTGTGVLATILFASSFFLVSGGDQRLGIVLTFIIILSRLIGPIRVLNGSRAGIIEKMPTMPVLMGILSLGEDQSTPNGTRIFSELQHGIVLTNVTFRYNQESPIVFYNTSLTIKKGAKVGLVGLSGAGKSTLVELLLRFYDSQEGSIYVDGVDLKELDIRSFRKHIGVVSQDIFLFNDTIRNNIRFAKPDATNEEIEQAATRSYAHEFIQKFPEGYDMVVGESGVLLSGGQRQRIAIARAILSEPEILIFDEATSALDAESAQIVQKAIAQVAFGKTVITIAHNLSTVVDSDIIYVIGDKRIVESGTHAELLRFRGVYCKLIEMQSAGAGSQEPL